MTGRKGSGDRVRPSQAKGYEGLLEGPGSRSGHGTPQEDRDRVLDLIADGMSPPKAMKAIGRAARTLYKWTKEDENDFAARYAIAMESYSHSLAESSHNLLDDASVSDVDPKQAMAYVGLLRERSKAKQWLASRLNQRQYGDKVDVTGTVTSAVVMLPPIDYSRLPTAKIATDEITDVELVGDGQTNSPLHEHRGLLGATTPSLTVERAVLSGDDA